VKEEVKEDESQRKRRKKEEEEEEEEDERKMNERRRRRKKGKKADCSKHVSAIGVIGRVVSTPQPGTADGRVLQLIRSAPLRSRGSTSTAATDDVQMRENTTAAIVTEPDSDALCLEDPVLRSRVGDAADAELGGVEQGAPVALDRALLPVAHHEHVEVHERLHGGHRVDGLGGDRLPDRERQRDTGGQARGAKRQHNSETATAMIFSSPCRSSALLSRESAPR
jgi:hypothetical protein